jgi:hypothetical protein
VLLGHAHVRLMDEGTNVCPRAGLCGAGLRVDIRRGSKQWESIISRDRERATEAFSVAF